MGCFKTTEPAEFCVEYDILEDSWINFRAQETLEFSLAGKIIKWCSKTNHGFKTCG